GEMPIGKTISSRRIPMLLSALDAMAVACAQVRRVGGEFEDFLVEIADHQLDNYARYQELCKQGKPDPEVDMISRWLRSRTREIDTRQYTITYRELKRILASKGFDLVEPYKNTVNVVQYQTRRRLAASWAVQAAR